MRASIATTPLRARSSLPPTYRATPTRLPAATAFHLLLPSTYLPFYILPFLTLQDIREAGLPWLFSSAAHRHVWLWLPGYDDAGMGGGSG